VGFLPQGEGSPQTSCAAALSDFLRRMIVSLVVIR